MRLTPWPCARRRPLEGVTSSGLASMVTSKASREGVEERRRGEASSNEVRRVPIALRRQEGWRRTAAEVDRGGLVSRSARLPSLSPHPPERSRPCTAATYSWAGMVPSATAMEKSQIRAPSLAKRDVEVHRCTGGILYTPPLSFLSHSARRMSSLERSARTRAERRTPGKAARREKAGPSRLRRAERRLKTRVQGSLPQSEPHPRFLPHNPPQLKIGQSREHLARIPTPGHHQLIDVLEL